MLLIKIAKQLNPQSEIFKMFAEDVAKIRKKVDTLTMIDVLEHTKEDCFVIKKMRKILNKNGRLIIVVPAFRFLYGKKDKKNGHYRRYSKKGLIKKLKKNGFKIDRIRYWNMLGFFPYLLYEKILNIEFSTELRTKEKKGDS